MTCEVWNNTVGKIKFWIPFITVILSSAGIHIFYTKNVADPLVAICSVIVVAGTTSLFSYLVTLFVLKMITPKKQDLSTTMIIKRDSLKGLI